MELGNQSSWLCLLSFFAVPKYKFNSAEKNGAVRVLAEALHYACKGHKSAVISKPCFTERGGILQIATADVDKNNCDTSHVYDQVLCSSLPLATPSG